MGDRISVEVLMEKWQEIHGKLDVFQKDLFVDHISIPKLQNYEMVEIEKALHITPKLSDALVLLEEYDNLDERIPDVNASLDDIYEFQDFESYAVYEVITPVEPAEDDILGLELAHDQQDQQDQTIHLWI